MILIEIEGGGVPRFRLEFHPRLTVVAGLDEVQRRELSQAIVNVLRGTGQRMKLTVDIGGAPQPYTYDAVLSTGMDKLQFDNVVTSATWRAEQRKQAGEGEGPAVDNAPLFGRTPALAAASNAPVEPNTSTALQVDALEEAVTEADSQLQAALVRVQQLEDEIASLPTVARADVEAAEEAVRAAQVVLDDLRGLLGSAEQPGAVAELDPSEELEQLTSLKAAIERRLASLQSSLEDEPRDTAGVQSALEEARRSAEVLRKRDELKSLLGQLGAEWSRSTMEIGRLSRQPSAPDWLVLQTKDQLEEASARVAALTYQLQEGIDVREPLARAQHRVVEAQAVWDEIQHGVEGKLAALQADQSRLHEKIVLLLGREVRGDQVIEALAEQHAEVETQPHPGQRLVDELKAAGVHAGLDDAIEKAEELLKQREELARVREDNQRQLATAMVDLIDVKRGMEAAQFRLDNSPQRRAGDEELEDRYSEAVVALNRAHENLAALTAPETESGVYDPTVRIALEQRLEAAHRAAATAQQHLEALSISSAGDADLFGGGEDAQFAEPDAGWRPWWEGGLAAQISDDSPSEPTAELDVYLLSRVAALRMLVHGESLPLIIDGVLEGLSQEEAGRVLEALAKVSSVVQVIYLASNADAAEKWAKRQEIFTTAVVRLERA